MFHCLSNWPRYTVHKVYEKYEIMYIFLHLVTSNFNCISPKHKQHEPVCSRQGSTRLVCRRESKGLKKLLLNMTVLRIVFNYNGHKTPIYAYAEGTGKMC